MAARAGPGFVLRSSLNPTHRVCSPRAVCALASPRLPQASPPAPGDALQLVYIGGGNCALFALWPRARASQSGWRVRATLAVGSRARGRERNCGPQAQVGFSQVLTKPWYTSAHRVDNRAEWLLKRVKRCGRDSGPSRVAGPGDARVPKARPKGLPRGAGGAGSSHVGSTWRTGL